MKDNKVRLVALPSFRVACFSGFGPSPEMAAWEKLTLWGTQNGLLPLQPGTRIFGFNDPDPSPGSPNYGYTFWITLDAAQVYQDAQIMAYPGGEYAVMACPGVEEIVELWKRLNQWIEQSSYVYGPYQWLEEVFLKDGNPEIFDHFDLYMPIQKA